VLPHVLTRRPEARLIVVGSDVPAQYPYTGRQAAIEIRGFVEDIRDPLAQYAVFVCPIRSGSGVRVKLLEAFSSGIPVVSTRIGAEGLAREDGEFCFLADDPVEFAEKVLAVFSKPEDAAEMARRARAEVAAHWDMTIITQKLADSYREAVMAKRATISRRGPV
jgi:glycosyltransferase involved in cell wall biosynthesis